MVAVAIIGILAAISSTHGMYLYKIKIDNAEIKVIDRQIHLVTARTGMTLGQIFGDWDFTGCKSKAQLESAGCKTIMDYKMRKLGFSGAVKNQWGYYYVINANEGQHLYGAGTCKQDAINTYRATN